MKKICIRALLGIFLCLGHGITGNTAVQKARDLSLGLPNPVSPISGIIYIQGGVVSKLSSDDKWVLGSYNQYPAVFDLHGNPSIITYGLKPSPKNIITGMTNGIICGNISTDSGVMPFYSHSGVGYKPIILPNFGGSVTGVANGISPNSTIKTDIIVCGTQLTGQTSYAPNTGAYVYSVANGFHYLPVFTGYPSHANAISNDGKIIVGDSGQTWGTYWHLTKTTGPYGFIGNTPSSKTAGSQMAITPSGSITVGVDSNNQAMSATLSSYPPPSVGPLTYNGKNLAYSEKPVSSKALAVSATGNTIGGSWNSTYSFLNIQNQNAISVENWLIAHGIQSSLPSPLQTGPVTGINSTDDVVVGNIGPSGAYIACIRPTNSVQTISTPRSTPPVAAHKNTVSSVQTMGRPRTKKLVSQKIESVKSRRSGIVTQ